MQGGHSCYVTILLRRAFNMFPERLKMQKRFQAYNKWGMCNEQMAHVLRMAKTPRSHHGILKKAGLAQRRAPRMSSQRAKKKSDSTCGSSSQKKRCLQARRKAFHPTTTEKSSRCACACLAVCVCNCVCCALYPLHRTSC